MVQFSNANTYFEDNSMSNIDATAQLKSGFMKLYRDINIKNIYRNNFKIVIGFMIK